MVLVDLICQPDWKLKLIKVGLGGMGWAWCVYVCVECGRRGAMSFGAQGPLGVLIQPCSVSVTSPTRAVHCRSDYMLTTC